MKKGLYLLIILPFWLLCIPVNGFAQEVIMEVADTAFVSSSDSIVRAVMLEAEAAPLPAIKMGSNFKPNPTKATLFALVPGMGQIYNRKYWKLPIVYGAFMGCYYAISWNHENYADYRQAYFDIMSTNPVANDSWRDFIPGGNRMTEEEQNAKINDTQFISLLKRNKDSFRRFRDLSIIITVGVYAISIIDAYVDAQLFDFDISPDLTMRIEPTFTPKTSVTPQTYGVNWSLTF
ncbi:DUF5683 domain-containing protein [Parabacteroides sp. OttesenSCG-928-G07]|nr:DUF5683 domain-containing protein [Parabacteroides sp. OttesenSCG-928-G21]MDL2278555.1 DUF5683 domain-containing protein [Parabacteroides sp. OttesenSCG-928-G07]